MKTYQKIGTKILDYIKSDISKTLNSKVQRTSLMILAIAMSATLAANHCYQRMSQPEQCIKSHPRYGDVKSAGLCDIDGDGNLDLVTLSPTSEFRIYGGDEKRRFTSGCNLDLDSEEGLERYLDCQSSLIYPFE